LNPRPGVTKGVCPLRGVTRRSERARGFGPLAGAGEASIRADPATERGSNPVSRSNSLNGLRHPYLTVILLGYGFGYGSDLS
jgi:hypothetical protein